MLQNKLMLHVISHMNQQTCIKNIDSFSE